MGPESGAKSGRRIAATARTGGGIAVAGPCSAPLARTVERGRAKPVPNLGGRFVRVGALLFATQLRGTGRAADGPHEVRWPWRRFIRAIPPSGRPT